MGGFMGSDPAPNLARLKSFIASRQLHYVLLSSGGGTGGAVGALGGRVVGAPGGGTGGPGASTSAATSKAISERDAWIEAHGTVVHVSGESSTAGGMTLYYFSGSQ